MTGIEKEKLDLLKKQVKALNEANDLKKIELKLIKLQITVDCLNPNIGYESAQAILKTVDNILIR